MASAITQKYIVLFISNILAWLDWDNDVIWCHYEDMLLNLLAKSNPIIFPSKRKILKEQGVWQNQEVGKHILINVRSFIRIWNLFVAYPQKSSLQSTVQS